MDGAFGIGAHLVGRSFTVTFGNDGLGGELAHLVLWPLRLFFCLRLLLLNRRVLAAWQNGATVLRLAVGRADLHELGFGRKGPDNVGINLRLITTWVCASILFPEVGKQELVMSCPLRAIDATSRGSDEMCVPPVEWSIFQQKQDVLFNPALQIADWEKDALSFAVAAGTPLLLKASGQGFLLFVR